MSKIRITMTAKIEVDMGLCRKSMIESGAWENEDRDPTDEEVMEWEMAGIGTDYSIWDYEESCGPHVDCKHAAEIVA